MSATITATSVDRGEAAVGIVISGEGIDEDITVDGFFEDQQEFEKSADEVLEEHGFSRVTPWSVDDTCEVVAIVEEVR